MDDKEQATLITGLKELQSKVNSLAAAQEELKRLLFEVIESNKALIELHAKRNESDVPQPGS